MPANAYVQISLLYNSSRKGFTSVTPEAMLGLQRKTYMRTCTSDSTAARKVIHIQELILELQAITQS